MKSENNLEELDMSFKGWKRAKLGDIVEISSSKRIFAKEYTQKGIPFYRGKEVIEKSQGNKISNELFISVDRYTEIKEKFGVPKQGDILLTSVGTLGVPYLVQEEEFYFKDGNLTWFKNFSSQCDNKFIYLWLQSSFCRNQIYAKAIGSTQKALTIETLKNFELLLPPLEEQKAIADILSSLDDKIELNNQMNETLEEMAQALFKRWFVDFEFPNEEGKPYKSSGGEMIESELGMIPKGWNVKSLDQIASFLNGLAMQKFRPNEDEDSLPVLKIKELRQEKVTSDSDRCTVNIDSKYKVNDGDVIFSWSGTLDARIWCGGEVGLNQHLFKVTSDSYPKWFYYMWVVEYLHQFIRIASDRATTMGHIKRQHLTEAQVLVPSREQLDKMGKVLEPIIEKIIQNKVEKRSLESLRDTVLPKLMSGEIRVSDLC